MTSCAPQFHTFLFLAWRLCNYVYYCFCVLPFLAFFLFYFERHYCLVVLPVSRDCTPRLVVLHLCLTRLHLCPLIPSVFRLCAPLSLCQFVFCSVLFPLLCSQWITGSHCSCPLCSLSLRFVSNFKYKEYFWHPCFASFGILFSFISFDLPGRPLSGL